MCAECTSINVIAIEFSRSKEREPTTSRTFVRLFVLYYKRARQSRQRTVRIECEDVLRVTITVGVWRSPLYKSNEEVLLLTKQVVSREKYRTISYCCSSYCARCIHKLETVAHINTAYNKEFNWNLWWFLFCKEDVTLLQGALKKSLNSPVIM